MCKGRQYVLALAQLLLCGVKVKIGVEVLEELGDGVRVGVRLLLQHSHEIVELVPPPLVRDDGCRQVPQDVRAGGLDGVQIPGKRRSAIQVSNEVGTTRRSWSCAAWRDALVLQEHVHDAIATVGVVEEYKQAPVKKPGSLLKLHKGRLESLEGKQESESVAMKRGARVSRRDKVLPWLRWPPSRP